MLKIYKWIYNLGYHHGFRDCEEEQGQKEQERLLERELAKKLGGEL